MWPDKETNIDYLNFGYMVDMVADIATNRDLSPSTIGLYGDWGSGKSSLMKFALKKIEENNPKNRKEKDTTKSLCIEFNGWLFEGYEDTVKQVSNYYKDLAFLSWEKFLTEKPGLCLYSLGFKKYIFFERVKYYMSSTSFTHTGNEIVPPVSVSYFDFELEEDFHYALDYKDNKDVGIATVTVNAINGFSGSKELLFSILPAASKKVTIYNVAQGIKVTWLPVEGATRYYVYRDGEHIKTTSVLEITDGDVKYRSGEKFTYWVIATAKSVGDSIFARTGTYYRLMPVGIKKVTNSGAGKMTVTYDKSSGSSGYVVRYGLKSDMSDAKVITVKGEDTLSRTFSNLTKGKTYYVQVRTYKIDNGIRYYSGYCTTKTVKIMK